MTEVRRFLDALPQETLVVFDEAYVEYADAPDFPDVLGLIRGEGPSCHCGHFPRSTVWRGFVWDTPSLLRTWSRPWSG